jgi:hypothetical protein
MTVRYFLVTLGLFLGLTACSGGKDTGTTGDDDDDDNNVGDDDDDDDDDDSDSEVEVDEDNDDDDDSSRREIDLDDRKGTTGPVTKRFRARGPVSIEVSSGQANVVVRTTNRGEVVIKVPACSRGGAHIDGEGEDIEVTLPWTCGGTIEIEAPPGSSVEVQTGEGNVQLDGQLDDVEVQTIAGNVTVGRARHLDVETVGGAVKVGAVTGRAKVQTVSGQVALTSVESPPRVSVETVGGQVEWRGQCGAGCRVDVNSMSGNVLIGSQAGSSYQLGFASRGGTLQAGEFLKIDSKEPGPRSRVKGKVGGGAGGIRILTQTGTARLQNT